MTSGGPNWVVKQKGPTTYQVLSSIRTRREIGIDFSAHYHGPDCLPSTLSYLQMSVDLSPKVLHPRTDP
jgi:hypothetical protein